MIFETGDTERQKKRVAFLRLTLLISISILTLIAVILPIILDSNAYTLNIGDVSPRSIEAPYAHSYQSKVLTDEAIEKSQLAINPIYLPADPAISRNQLEKLRLSNAYISTVRVDSYASQEQKLEDISKLADVNIRQGNCKLYPGDGR